MSGIGSPALSGSASGGGSSTIISPIGQKAMAASVSVVIASDQSAIPVTGTFWQTTQPVSLSVLPSVAALADTTSNPTLTQIQTFPMVYNGTNWDRLPGDKTVGSFVSISTSSTSLADASSNSAHVAADQGHSPVNLATYGYGFNGTTWDRLRTVGTGILNVGIADGSGNELTSNSTTYTAKKALDGNLLGTLGTAFSTAGKIDVKGADGDVFVRQSTASNLLAQVSNNGTFAVQAAQSGNWTDRIVGNAGGILDQATGSAVPANAIQIGISDGTNLRAPTANSTTYTSKYGMDVNLLGTLGTAFSTAGKVDVKGADGDVFVRQATGSNLHMVVDSGTVTTVSNLSQIASTTPTFTSQALDVNIKSETAPAVSLTRVAIAASSSGDNTIIAAVTSKKIYVVAFELSFSGTVNAKFTDGASGTNLGGLYYGVANAGAADSISPDMKLATPSPYLWAGSTNTALILNLSGATAVGGAVTYFTV